MLGSYDSCALGYPLSFTLIRTASQLLELRADLPHCPDGRALRQHTLYPSTISKEAAIREPVWNPRIPD